jgi:hypothetical protein
MQKIANVALLLGVLTYLSASPSYAAVIGVDSASSLGANDAIGWGQINLPAGQSTKDYTGPLNVVSTNGNTATVSVGGNETFFRVDQAPGGDYFGNFAPGTQLISSGHNYEGIVITFDQPVYGGGAQVSSGSYGAYTAIVIAFAGTHQLGTYSAAGTTTTDGLNNPVHFIGLLSDAPNITSLIFFADSVLSQDETVIATVSLNEHVVPPVPELSTWAMLLLGFAGIGFVTYRRRLTARRPRLVRVSMACYFHVPATIPAAKFMGVVTPLTDGFQLPVVIV